MAFRGEAVSLSDAERATPGYLSYFCFHQGYDPMVVPMPDMDSFIGDIVADLPPRKWAD